MHHGSVRHFRLWPAIFIFSAFPVLSAAQSSGIAPRITAAVDEAQLTALPGNVHPLARPEFDRGIMAPSSLPMQRMLLVLKRSAQQETALDALLDQQQDKSSPNYHQWLTPDQIGQQFGPADQDIVTITLWLQSFGFEINRVAPSRTVIEFSGTAGQVQEAFHTPIHKFVVNGKDHWANSANPQIPTALAPVIAGVDSLNNFPRRPMSRIAGPVSRSRATGQITSASPLFNLGGNCGVPGIGCHGVGPYDFATIYDLFPLWTATPHIDGTGQTIAIVGVSNINIQDVRDFRNFFGLPAKDPQIIVNGPDPGLVSGPETEADLDAEWAGAVAPNAAIDLIVSESTESTDGTDLSAEYAVENDVAPILSVSFGECEAGLGTSGNQFFSQLWQQAAAQGITVLVSTGDSGSAGCDNTADGTAPLPAEFGLQVNGLSSTPYNVAVGGTDFNDLTNASTYWNTSNSAPPGNPSALPTLSAKSYIPETTWNDSCTNAVFGTLLGYSTNAETNCNNSQLVNFVVPIGGSGGKSSCTSGDGSDVTSCSGGYSKPSWQVGSGVPSDGKRDVPDVSLFASVSSPSGSFYIVCEADFLFPGASSCDPTNANTNFLGVGGTSASVQAFAGIMALVNQETNSIQGNANYILYKLAAQQPSAFHDVPTGGTIAMPCATGTPNCVTSKSGDAYGVLSGYTTTTGYDLATGLGSVDANNFVTKWSSVTTTLKTSTTALTLNSGNPVNITHGQPVSVAVGVTGSPGTPTGNVSLIANAGPNGQDGVQDFTLTSGAVSSATTLLPGGTYSVFARYAGDGIFGASASTPSISVTVSPESSKTFVNLVTLDINGNPTNFTASSGTYGSGYNFLRVDVGDAAASVSSSSGVSSNCSKGVSSCPTGTVSIASSGSPLPVPGLQLNSKGYAEIQPIGVGTYAISASYGGDSSYGPNASAANFTIAKAPTTASAAVAGLPVQYGGFEEITATITTTSNGIAPTGSFSFFLDGSPLTTSFLSYEGFPYQPNTSPPFYATLSAIGSTEFLSLGNHTLTAQYSGDANYAPSSSGPTTITVTKAQPFFLSWGASPATINLGEQSTLQARLAGSDAGVSPTGTMTFYDGGTALSGAVTYTPLAAGFGATMPFTPTSAGTHNISVSYSGDSYYLPATTGGTASLNVIGPTFSLTANPTTISISSPGQSGTTTLTFTSINGFSGSATLSSANCTGLPSESTCGFSPPTIDLPASGSVTTRLTVTTTARSELMPGSGNHPRFLPPRSMAEVTAALACLLCAGMIVAWTRFTSRRPLAVSGLLALAILLAIAGCGGGGKSGGGTGRGSDPGTLTGQYVISVSATVNGVSQTLSGVSVIVQ